MHGSLALPNLSQSQKNTTILLREKLQNIILLHKHNHFLKELSEGKARETRPNLIVFLFSLAGIFFNEVYIVFAKNLEEDEEK